MLRQRAPVCRQESGKEVEHVRIKSGTGAIYEALERFRKMRVVLEMPYIPPLAGSKEEGEYPYTYRLAGSTCLAGE